MREVWIKYAHWDLDHLDELTDCPYQIENLDSIHQPSLTWPNVYDVVPYPTSPVNYIVYRWRTYFIPPQTGVYIFNSYCNNGCRIKIENVPGTLKTMLETAGYYDSDNCWSW